MSVYNDQVRVLSVLVIVFGVALVQFVDSTPVESLIKDEDQQENEIQTDVFDFAHVREKKSIHNKIDPVKQFSSSKENIRADEKHFPKEEKGTENMNDNLQIFSKVDKVKNDNDNISRNLKNIDNVSNYIKTERKNKRRHVERINGDSEQYLRNGEYIDKIIFSEHGNQLPMSRRSPRQTSPLVVAKPEDGSLRFAADYMTQGDRPWVNEYDTNMRMNEMPAVMSPRYNEMADYNIYYPASRYAVDADTMMMAGAEGYEPVSRAMDYDPILTNKKDNFASAYVMEPDNRQHEYVLYRTADDGYGANNGAKSEDNYRAADGGVNRELVPKDNYAPESRTFNLGHVTSPSQDLDVPDIDKEQHQHHDGHHSPSYVMVQPLVVPLHTPGCLFPSENPYLHQHHHHTPLPKPDLSLLPLLPEFLLNIIKPESPETSKPDFPDILKPQYPENPKPDVSNTVKPERQPSIVKPIEIAIPKPNIPIPQVSISAGGSSQQSIIPQASVSVGPPPQQTTTSSSSGTPGTKPVIYVSKQYVVDQNPMQVPVYEKVDDIQQQQQLNLPVIHRTYIMQPSGRIQGYTSASPAPYRDPLPYGGRHLLGDDYYVKVPYLIDMPPVQRAQNEIIVKPQSVKEILLGAGTPKGILQSGNQDLSMNNTLSQTQVLRGALEGGGGLDYGSVDSTLGTPPQEAPADPLREYMLSRMRKIDRDVGELSRKLNTLQLQQRLAHVLAGDTAFLRRPTHQKRENRKEDLKPENEEDDEICCEETEEQEKQQQEASVNLSSGKAVEGTEESGTETKETRKDDNRKTVAVMSMKEKNKKTTKENTNVNVETKTQPNKNNKAPL